MHHDGCGAHAWAAMHTSATPRAAASRCSTPHRPDFVSSLCCVIISLITPFGESTSDRDQSDRAHLELIN